MRFFYTILSAMLLLVTPNLQAQVTGGQYAFAYLRMSNSTYVTALGGIAPANGSRDVSLTLQNPGLLRPEMHNQFAVGYNIYYTGIGIANIQYAYHIPKLQTDFGFGVQYLHYGKIVGTDIYGNEQGEFMAGDYSVNLSASRQYSERWRYGTTLKWAHSVLGERSGMAVVADFGIAYTDSANLLTIGAVAKNIGFVAKKYNPQNEAEPLPFDLQLGITKGLKNVPLRLFLVAHHLYRWDIRYDNPADRVNTSIFGEEQNDEDKTYFFDKFFRHLNFGAEIVLAKKLTATVAYNHLRRRENGVSDAMGLAGFSFGLGLELNKLQVKYARSYYGSAGAYHEVGFNLQLNKFFDIGKKSEQWGWHKQYY